MQIEMRIKSTSTRYFGRVIHMFSIRFARSSRTTSSGFQHRAAIETDRYLARSLQIARLSNLRDLPRG